jgi:hypothetical protein
MTQLDAVHTLTHFLLTIFFIYIIRTSTQKSAEGSDKLCFSAVNVDSAPGLQARYLYTVYTELSVKGFTPEHEFSRTSEPLFGLLRPKASLNITERWFQTKCYGALKETST